MMLIFSLEGGEKSIAKLDGRHGQICSPLSKPIRRHQHMAIWCRNLCKWNWFLDTMYWRYLLISWQNGQIPWSWIQWIVELWNFLFISLNMLV